jgi:sugar lactone lactonase YvrE
MSEAVRIAANTADVLGESPVWDAATRALWWVDMRRPALHRLDRATGDVETVATPDLCPAILPLHGEAFLVALGLAFHRFDPARKTFEMLFAVEQPEATNRLNDSKADRQGRLWAGTMRDFGAAKTGALYREARGTMTRVLGPLTVPNALCFSPTGDRVYFADTREGAILVADLDGDGAPGAFRVFAPDGAAPGKPDGATVDAEGHVWNARFGGGCVARFSPDGALDRTIEIPATQATACAFGGDDLATLYITTARQKLTDEQLAAQPLAGALFAIEPDARGIAETPCRVHR